MIFSLGFKVKEEDQTKYINSPEEGLVREIPFPQAMAAIVLSLNVRAGSSPREMIINSKLSYILLIVWLTNIPDSIENKSERT